MSKKILLIIGIVAIIGIAAFLIWGSAQPAGTGESRIGFSVRDFLPFGQNSEPTDNSATTTPQGDGAGTEPVNNLNAPIPRLRKLSNEPVAGAVAFNTGSTTVVRFVEKGTGNVYEATSDSLNLKRLTNTTIPKIVRAFWLPNGSGFLAQTILPESELIQTDFVKLSRNTASSSVEGLTPFSTTISKLPTGVKEITVSPDSGKIFYYTISGSSNWYISNPDGTSAALVLTHPLTEWLPIWTNLNTISLQNKSSASVTSYGYSFDVKNKVLKKSGLAATGLSMNPASDLALTLASNGGSAPQLFIFDNKNVSLKSIKINTLAEKCVWTKQKTATVYCAIPSQIPTGIYPDNWYQGLVHTEDFLERVDLTNEIYSLTSNLSRESEEKIDAVDLDLSTDESHLIFRNKTDGFLWLLRIES